MSVDQPSDWENLVAADRDRDRKAVERLPFTFWQEQKRRILARLEEPPRRRPAWPLWLPIPLRAWAVVAAGALLAVFLFVSLRREAVQPVRRVPWTTADSVDDRLLADIQHHLQRPEGKALEPARLLLTVKQP